MSIKALREVIEYMKESGETRKTELFVVDGDISNEENAELLETAVVLHKHTGFKLPYDTMAIGLPMGDVLVVYFAEQRATEISFTWVLRHTSESGFIYFTPAPGRYDIARLFMPVVAMRETETFDFSSHLLKLQGGKDQTSWGTFLLCSLALLCVRGIEKERIEPTEDQQKARLRRRKEPLDAVTVVRIQKHMQGAERGPGGERMAVRLHLRRGHYRGQHYGPGNSKVKQVFIEPCLVGHEDQGTITHDHYEIDETID